MKVANLKMQEELGQTNLMKACLEDQWKKGLLKQDTKGAYIAVEDPEEQHILKAQITKGAREQLSQELKAGREVFAELGKKAMEKYGNQSVQDAADDNSLIDEYEDKKSQ